jgi:hypothetical protein
MDLNKWKKEVKKLEEKIKKNPNDIKISLI